MKLRVGTSRAMESDNDIFGIWNKNKKKGEVYLVWPEH